MPDGGAVLDPDEVRASVAQFLPGYMVPSTVLILDRLPVTAHGKLDRGSLPVPGATEGSYVAPRNPVEEIVAGVMTDLLGVDRVGAADGFFVLGGNSLVSAQLVARINDATGAALGIRDVFDGPTVAELARRVGGEGSGVRRSPLIPQARPARIPLSPAQLRMWFVNQYDPQSPAYNISFSLRLSGHLDVSALRAALGDVIARHESLRTVYPLTDDGPCQEILPAELAEPGLEVVRVRDADDLHARMWAATARGFDVADQIPLRAILFRADETNHVLTVVLHHILADGFSLNPLARDVAAAYAARLCRGAPQWPPLTAQYADYSLWQREWLGSEDDASSPLARQLDYWTTTLSGLDEVLDLPSDRPRPAVRSQSGGRVAFTVDERLHRSLIALAHRHDASVFMVVHAALATLLSRLACTDDIAIGTPIAGRGAAALDDMVGMFVGTLVLRCDVGGACSFGELLRRVRETDLGAFTHADIPFERIVEALDPPRSHAHTPLFQVMLEFRTIARPDLALPDLRVEALDSGDVAANFDLQLTVAEEFDATGGAAGMAAGLVFATDMFDEATARTFADRFVRILEAVAQSPDMPVADIEILDGAERAALTAVRGAPGAPPRTLAAVLAAGAAIDPRSPAIRFDGNEISYLDLDRVSTGLARRLIDVGVGPGSVVALGMPRSVEYIIGLWAVAKTGAAFVPIDPAHPADRIAFMLDDSGAVLGLTVAQSRDALPDALRWWTLDADRLMRDHTAVSPIRDTDRTTRLRLDQAAYLIYTSGSTGIPKGVTVSHRGLAAFADHVHKRCRTTPRSRALHFTSPSFDASILDFILAFGAGGPW
ncbi:hxxPF-repeated domain protein [Rhodococcus sp. MTM3W5.2]|nr:hxxPF-repeated domain protein [Rhodococcus sp. MTM3W5.2]